MVLLVLFSEILFALSLGLGISYVLKGNAAGAVIMVIIQLAAFFGGGYMPVASTTGFMRKLQRILPCIGPMKLCCSSSIQAVGRQPCMR